jgi:hypothetical protein
MRTCVFGAGGVRMKIMYTFIRIQQQHSYNFQKNEKKKKKYEENIFDLTVLLLAT